MNSVAQFMSHCCNSQSAPREYSDLDPATPECCRFPPTLHSIAEKHLSKHPSVFRSISPASRKLQCSAEDCFEIWELPFCDICVYGRVIYANSPAIKWTSGSDACFLPLGFRFSMWISVFSESVRNFHCKFMHLDDTYQTSVVWERKQHPLHSDALQWSTEIRLRQIFNGESKVYIWPRKFMRTMTGCV